MFYFNCFEKTICFPSGNESVEPKSIIISINKNILFPEPYRLQLNKPHCYEVNRGVAFKDFSYSKVLPTCSLENMRNLKTVHNQLL